MAKLRPWAGVVSLVVTDLLLRKGASLVPLEKMQWPEQAREAGWTPRKGGSAESWGLDPPC